MHARNARGLRQAAVRFQDVFGQRGNPDPDRRRRGKRVRAAAMQFGDQFRAMAAGHLDVAQHGVERLAPKQLGGLRAALRRHHGTYPQLPQQSFGCEPLERVVFDNEDAQGSVMDRHGRGGCGERIRAW
ncbi:hypothetical protein D9M72_550340 [compost metagenome]